MQGAIIVAIVFAGVVLALAVIGGTIIMAIKAIRGRRSGEASHLNPKETRMIQEIYNGLARMEERVEALETILLDRERKDKSL
jgi:phage shock protein B